MSDEALLGLSEVADFLDTTRQSVANWRQRKEDFPEPVADLRSGPIWRRTEIETWAAENGISLRELNTEDPRSDTNGATTAVAIVNMKGGVGKSTLTANLGWYCAYQQDKRVLLVDLDPQFNLSQYVMGTDGYEQHLKDGKGTVLEIFEQATPKAVSGSKMEQLNGADVIGTIREFRDGGVLHLIPSRLDLAWTLKNPHQKEHLLSDFLDEVREDYDLILLDCPPTESMLTTAAYLSSDSVLIPVKPEFLSTIGLPLVVKSLKDFGVQYRKREIDVLGIVFNASTGKLEHERSRRFVRKVAKQNRWYVFRHEVSFSDSYPKGSRLGKPIFLTDYARWTKISDFYEMAEEFLGRTDE